MNFDMHHGRENNQESQEIYDLNVDRLNKNCRIIFEQLMTGRKLTGMDVVKLGMMEYRKRFDDLKKLYGIPVKDRKIKGNFKEWYLEREYINSVNIK